VRTLFMEKEMPFGPKTTSIYNTQGVQMFKQKVAAECVKRDRSTTKPLSILCSLHLFNFSFPSFY